NSMTLSSIFHAFILSHIDSGTLSFYGLMAAVFTAGTKKFDPACLPGRKNQVLFLRRLFSEGLE
ncbi:MAG: hypothetical protein WC450_12250, partial [Candidatus Omnitrophota bacterium]